MAGKKRLITPEQIELSKERRRAYDRARHARDKEKRNAARRAAHAANPERLRNIERLRYQENPQQRKRNDMISKYGLEAYDAYQKTSNCESCGSEISGIKKHVDHDHSLPRNKGFRGILCNGCNVALGYLKEDTKRILALADYITRKRKMK